MKKLFLGLLAAGAVLAPTAVEAHSAYHYHEHHHHSSRRPHGGKPYCHYHDKVEVYHCHHKGEGRHPWRNHHQPHSHRTGVYFWFGS
jgi:hypothetical protein